LQASTDQAHVPHLHCNIRIAASFSSMLQGHLAELPCTAGSSWLQQLQHLGASLARLQRMLSAAPASSALNGAAAGRHGNEQQQQQQGAAVSSRDVALAVAAGILQPVVLELELRVRAAAAAAVAAPDDPRFKRVSDAL
jgi:hypothetical protein